MKELKASLIGILIGSSSFAILCLVFDAPDTTHFIFAVCVGAFSGLLAAPEISPESYRYPKICQVISSVAAGVFVGLFFSVSGQYMFGLCVLGAVIGLFAKQFVNSVTVP